MRLRVAEGVRALPFTSNIVSLDGDASVDPSQRLTAATLSGARDSAAVCRVSTRGNCSAKLWVGACLLWGCSIFSLAFADDAIFADGFDAFSALDITVDTNLDGEIVVHGPVVVHSGATLNSPTGNITIRANGITIEIGASITAAPTGMNPQGAGSGCGAGGGYGTAGSYNASCGPTGQGQAFGSTTDATVEQGSNGGDSNGGTPGGKGGGVVRLIAGTIDVAGQVAANGEDGGTGGAGGGGGGSGGGILLAADSLTVSGLIAASGGAGGGFSSGFAGSAGGAGRVKLLHGTTASMTGTIVGTLTQGLMPPLVLKSSSHPDQDLVYNDDFSVIDVSWDPPFPSAQGYYQKTSTDRYSPPTPLTGLFTPSEMIAIDRSACVQGANYFHIVSVDASSNVGLVEDQFRIQVNTVPPTVSSSSHPSQTTWYGNANPFFSWTLPNADLNYQGYLYVLDHYGDTVPSPTDAFLGVGQKQILLSNLAAGIWDFHLVSVDQQGYRTKAARHYQVRIGADPGTGTILGAVTDGGSPIAGATVRINRSLIGPDQMTIANGTYNFGATVPAGTWDVSVSKAGYQPQVHTVVVTAGQTTTANFALTP